MTGNNPLRGPNLDDFGPRFPDMSQVYDRQIMDIVRAEAIAKKITLREGVYCGLAGPSFETPADLRFLRTIGADAVGMSTVPEAIVARHASMRVLGLSGISNKANLDGNTVIPGSFRGRRPDRSQAAGSDRGCIGKTLVLMGAVGQFFYGKWFIFGSNSMMNCGFLEK
jgi:hypothetical protein